METTLVQTETHPAPVDDDDAEVTKKTKSNRSTKKRPEGRRMRGVTTYVYEKTYANGKRAGSRIHHDPRKLRKRQHHFYSESKKGQVGLVVSRARTGSKLRKQLKKALPTMNAFVNVCSGGKRNEIASMQVSSAYISTNAAYLDQLYKDIYQMVERRATQPNGHVNKVTEAHVNDVLQMRKLM